MRFASIGETHAVVAQTKSSSTASDCTRQFERTASEAASFDGAWVSCWLATISLRSLHVCDRESLSRRLTAGRTTAHGTLVSMGCELDSCGRWL